MKESLKLALEALQVATTPLAKDRQEVLRAITAIKEALAQPNDTAKLYEELRSIIDGGSESFTHEDAVKYLKDKLAQPELCKYGQERKSCTSSPMDCQCVIDAALAQPEQEPVAWGMMNDDGSIYDCICPEEHERVEGEYTIPLYTTPPQRKPLTDELLSATQTAIQCSYSDHGRRSVNAQAWDRMIQAIAAHTNGIKGEA